MDFILEQRLAIRKISIELTDPSESSNLVEQCSHSMKMTDVTSRVNNCPMYVTTKVRDVELKRGHVD